MRILALFPALAACTPDKEDPKSTTTSTATTTTTPTDATVVPVDEHAADGFGLQLCANDSGVFVLWMDDRREPGAGLDLWLASSPDGETWGSPVRLTHGPLANRWNPHMVCNDELIAVAWEDDRDGELENHQIYFNRSVDGGSSFLSEDLLLENDADGRTMSLQPHLAAVGTELFVVWYDNLNGAYDILGVGSGDGGLSWRNPIRIDSDPPGSAYSARPRAALGANGNDIWVTWEDSRDGRTDIRFARSVNGGATFQADVRIDGGIAGAVDSWDQRLCTDGAATVTVVWHEGPPDVDRRDVVLNRSTDAGASWLQEPERVDTRDTGRSVFADCVITGRDTHVAWWEGTQGEIAYRLLEGGVPGDDPVMVGAGNAPLLDAQGGDVVVAWSSEEDGASFAEMVSNDGAVGLPTQGDDLTVAVHDGNLFTAWVRGGDIYLARVPL